MWNPDQKIIIYLAVKGRYWRGPLGIRRGKGEGDGVKIA
jgi:hypothetical protein